MNRYLCFALCALIVGTGNLARADTPKTAPATVPFDLLKSKHMVLMIKVNGKGPYRVIFDTGAPVMLLNTKVARASGVLAKSARPSLFAPFGTMGQMTIKTLEVGDLKAENVAVVVMDHPTVEVISKILGPIEGIVGFPFFARYKMTIDYQAKQLTFVPNGFKPPDVMQGLITSVMAMADDKPVKPTVLAPAGQWGLVVHKDTGDDEAGVTIDEVLPGSAGAQAGLKAGDRLLTLDGRWTDTLADTYLAASYVKAGTATKVVVQRGKEEISLTVTPRAGL
jgi:membrane-associated protease RseP (regulator of RpoE activity)